MTRNSARFSSTTIACRSTYYYSMYLTNGFDRVDDLLLDKVEGHGDHGDPEEQVDRAQDDSEICNV